MITRIFAATNAASDPATNYEIAPQELFRLMREIRAAKLELLGIYHSHPNGKNEPSARDIELAYYPDTAYFILSPLPWRRASRVAARPRIFYSRRPRDRTRNPNYLGVAPGEICSNARKANSKACAGEAAQKKALRARHAPSASALG